MLQAASHREAQGEAEELSASSGVEVRCAKMDGDEVYICRGAGCMSYIGPTVCPQSVRSLKLVVMRCRALNRCRGAELWIELSQNWTNSLAQF